MKTTGRNRGKISEIVTDLDLVIATLGALDLKANPRAQVREAGEALDRIISLIGPEARPDLPPSLRARVIAAKHCLRMGKPRECLSMIEGLRAEVLGEAAD